MKLADWFAIRNPDGSRRLQYVFAEKIGRTAGMVSEYVQGTTWPDRETMERIVAATDGEVTANDFLRLDQTEGAE